jgi:hypothetical protein
MVQCRDIKINVYYLAVPNSRAYMKCYPVPGWYIQLFPQSLRALLIIFLSLELGKKKVILEYLVAETKKMPQCK